MSIFRSSQCRKYLEYYSSGHSLPVWIFDFFSISRPLKGRDLRNLSRLFASNAHHDEEVFRRNGWRKIFLWNLPVPKTNVRLRFFISRPIKPYGSPTRFTRLFVIFPLFIYSYGSTTNRHYKIMNVYDMYRFKYNNNNNRTISRKSTNIVPHRLWCRAIFHRRTSN